MKVAVNHIHIPSSLAFADCALAHRWNLLSFSIILLIGSGPKMVSTTPLLQVWLTPSIMNTTSTRPVNDWFPNYTQCIVVRQFPDLWLLLRSTSLHYWRLRNCAVWFGWTEHFWILLTSGLYRSADGGGTGGQYWFSTSAAEAVAVVGDCTFTFTGCFIE